MRLILALDAATEDRLLPAVLAAGHDIAARPAGGVELASALRSVPADAALVSGSPRMLSAAVLSVADAAGVRLVALIDGPEERGVVAALNLREAVDAAAPWSDIERMLAGRPAPDPAEAERPSGRGRVVAVWGPTGAPGRTTTAITVAAELAIGGRRVLLADADTQGASIAPALGLLDEAPGFAAACRLAGTDALSGRELERIAERYRIGDTSFGVLTGLARPSRWPELAADRVTATLRECRQVADLTVVDAGFNLESDEEIVSDLFAPRRNAATIAALREADVVLAVGAADPIGLARFLRAHADLLELVGPEPVRVVVTKVRAAAVGVSPASQIAATLLRFGGITEPALVPWDPAGCDAALLAGRTLQESAPRSPALAAIRDLVRRELSPSGEGAVRDPLIRRLRDALRGGTGPATPPIGAA
ncbi:regulator [Naasia sp. SYSU D00057]|uniref:AAA family ATPase n=1 Tax=Naasia sp. SYSU D00057 TaxID=2817380 RepID=UPI001B304CD5|nr:regulator [Naasia sp. SYSU D00057]